MPPVALLALLSIALLLLSALRLELDFRRSSRSPGAREPRSRPPELRAAPAGGYCQTRWPAPPSGKAEREAAGVRAERERARRQGLARFA